VRDEPVTRKGFSTLVYLLGFVNDPDNSFCLT
jgi:hypothetical protein